MNNFQKEKQLILNYYKALSGAKIEDLHDVCSNFLSKNCLWQSYHPFKEQIGARSVAEHFWIPFKNSFRRLQRRQDIFFAGKNELANDGSVWVVSMGHLMGLFDKKWLSIQKQKKWRFFAMQSSIE